MCVGGRGTAVLRGAVLCCAVMSIDFWRVSGRELAHPTSSLLPAVLWFYRLSCISLNSLNAMWFYKMLKGAIKVLAGICSVPADLICCSMHQKSLSHRMTC